MSGDGKPETRAADAILVRNITGVIFSVQSHKKTHPPGAADNSNRAFGLKKDYFVAIIDY